MGVWRVVLVGAWRLLAVAVPPQGFLSLELDYKNYYHYDYFFLRLICVFVCAFEVVSSWRASASALAPAHAHEPLRLHGVSLD